MKVLEVENISKTFAALKAVDQVSFEIEEGVSFGLLGPNGAGKTTTIRMITNIIIPDSGRVSVMGNGDLKEIRAGSMDPSGEQLTNIGRILGMIGTILILIGLCVWLFVVAGAIVAQ